MKKCVALLGVLVAVLIPAVSNATGSYMEGYVVVNNSTTGSSYMYGAMNNRYSTRPTTYSTFVRASGVANSTVTFSGQDGDGDFFYCYVSPSNSLYGATVNIMNGLANGTFINVSKPAGSSECNYVYVNKASYSLD